MGEMGFGDMFLKSKKKDITFGEHQRKGQLCLVYRYARDKRKNIEEHLAAKFILYWYDFLEILNKWQWPARRGSVAL
jgi:hypothetical protein